MPTVPGDFPIAVHPGEILREVLDERGITQMRLARHVNTDISRINDIFRGRRGLSAATAVMLAKALGTSAGLWLNLQNNWELSRLDPRVVRR
jgi:addiction module HigA family antidote